MTDKNFRVDCCDGNRVSRHSEYFAAYEGVRLFTTEGFKSLKLPFKIRSFKIYSREGWLFVGEQGLPYEGGKNDNVQRRPGQRSDAQSQP